MERKIKYSMLAISDIKVYLRDLNGDYYLLKFRNNIEAYEHLVEEDDLSDDVYEIMIVTAKIEDGTRVCLFSGLGRDEALTFEDLIGFFA